MVKTNMHIHSKYSWDSKMEIPRIAKILVENNAQYAVLIDHVELDRETLDCILLEGIEISEPHWYPDKVEYLLEHTDLDFIMGSIHKIDKNGKSDLDKKRITYLYYKGDYSDNSQVKEIITAIKEHDRIIEVNTSAKKRANLNLFPSIDKLSYYKLVNSDVTIGTDAHRYNELTDNLEQAELVCQEIGLESVIYQKRKKTRI